MDKYLKVMSIGIQNELEYRFNFLSKVVFSFVPFFVNLFLWKSIGYSDSQGIISYYYVTLILNIMIINNIAISISNEIRTGNINKYLIKPINYFLYYVSLDFPKRLVYMSIGMPIIVLLGFFIRGELELQFRLYNVLLFIGAALIGYMVNILISYILGITTFYFSEISSLYSTLEVIKSIFAGTVFPISLLSGTARILFHITPFPYICYVPASVFLGRFTIKEVEVYLVIGVMWVLMLYIISRLLWKSGIYKYSAFGG